MLKITRKVEYALIALNHLQQQNDGDLCSAKEISKQYGIPQELLAKTLQKLARVEIIEAVQGSTGGYKLLVDPSTISMTHFFEILEGPVGIMDCYFDSGCRQLNTCNIRSPINKINDAIRNVFNNITLADLT
ncbi:MAG TPA: Rrf2 family transcriptional regulator [Candidatus Marinimicrobia bacterium]|nr:Rrf2 family transcriptional regulator [Candidatus Neomarinimicrobiota bacterium]HIA80142.1 Rrf2 family transcriptional regulator [Candidatus Neomarinimicrobiota bacterium]